jgi:hypothetical protein
LLRTFPHVNVLEWGAGFSTKYFTDFLIRAGIPYSWDAMESDEGWANHVRGLGLPGVTVTLADKDSEEYLKPPKAKYDLIYVDGRNRVRCLKKARELLAPGGSVLLHDAQREKYQDGFEGYSHRMVGGAVKLWHGRLGPWPVIPRVIHQMWVGPKAPPLEWIETWKAAHPGWEHILWDETAIDAMGLRNRKQYDRYMKERCYHGASNVARAEILLRQGGVYMDADSICKTTMEGALFMDGDFFSVYEGDNYHVDGLRLVANGIIGAAPRHRYLAELVARIGDATELNPSWRKTGPLLWTGIVQGDPAILPPYTFLPVHHTGYRNKVDGIVYAEQFWSSTQELRKKNATNKAALEAPACSA